MPWQPRSAHRADGPRPDRSADPGHHHRKDRREPHPHARGRRPSLHPPPRRGRNNRPPRCRIDDRAAPEGDAARSVVRLPGHARLPGTGRRPPGPPGPAPGRGCRRHREPAALLGPRMRLAPPGGGDPPHSAARERNRPARPPPPLVGHGLAPLRRTRPGTGTRRGAHHGRRHRRRSPGPRGRPQRGCRHGRQGGRLGTANRRVHRRATPPPHCSRRGRPLPYRGAVTSPRTSSPPLSQKPRRSLRLRIPPLLTRVARLLPPPLDGRRPVRTGSRLRMDRPGPSGAGDGTRGPARRRTAIPRAHRADSAPPLAGPGTGEPARGRRSARRRTRARSGAVRRALAPHLVGAHRATARRRHHAEALARPAHHQLPSREPP